MSRIPSSRRHSLEAPPGGSFVGWHPLFLGPSVPERRKGVIFLQHLVGCRGCSYESPNELI